MRLLSQGLILLLGFALAIPEPACAKSRSGESCCLKESAPACCCSESTKASADEHANQTRGCNCRSKSPRKGETPAGIPGATPTALVHVFATYPAERKCFREASLQILRLERGTSLHSPPPRLRLTMQQRFLI